MGLLQTPGRLIHVRSVDGEALCAVAQHCPGGANGGDNACVSGERQSSLGSRNSSKTQRPALVCAGRAGLRIESSTTELRWRRFLT